MKISPCLKKNKEEKESDRSICVQHVNPLSKSKDGGLVGKKQTN